MNNNPCSVNCHTCGKNVWTGGAVSDDPDRQIIGLPFGKVEISDDVTVDLGHAQDLLTLWADANCTREDCVHTTGAREAARARDPDVMAERIAQLEALVAELTRNRPGPTDPKARR